jgi:hypothetical protein
LAKSIEVLQSATNPTAVDFFGDGSGRANAVNSGNFPRNELTAYCCISSRKNCLGEVPALFTKKFHGGAESAEGAKLNLGPVHTTSGGGFSLQPGVEAEGTGPIFLISSLLFASVTSYSALLASRNEKNWLPSPPPEVV